MRRALSSVLSLGLLGLVASRAELPWLHSPGWQHDKSDLPPTGVVLCAAGEARALEQALHLANAIRAAEPGLGIAVLTEREHRATLDARNASRYVDRVLYFRSTAVKLQRVGKWRDAVHKFRASEASAVAHAAAAGGGGGAGGDVGERMMRLPPSIVMKKMQAREEREEE